MGLVETYVKEHPWISGVAVGTVLLGTLAMPSVVRRVGSYLSSEVVPEPNNSGYVDGQLKAEKQYANTFEGRLERLKDNFDSKMEKQTFEFLSDVQASLDKNEEALRQQAETRAAEILNPAREQYLDNSKRVLEDGLSPMEE